MELIKLVLILWILFSGAYSTLLFTMLSYTGNKFSAWMNLLETYLLINGPLPVFLYVVVLYLERNYINTL